MGKSIDILLGLAFVVGGSIAAVAAEPPVCDSADHCVWIMENHGPHEFDYDVLIKELEGFGAAGKDYLVMLAGDKDANIAGRAMDILNAGRFEFSREEARGLLGEWPGANVDKLANLMVKIGSPDVQGRMIESLTHEDGRVRDAARNVLNRMRENRKVYQLRSFEYGPVAKAVVENPTRELVQMLAVFPPDKTRPILTQALKSGQAPSVITAYAELYAMDKETAFEALLVTLRNMDDQEAKAALALGALLRHRHKSRPDGFYLQFAKELAEDPKMSLMGRVAGVEAIMGGDSNKSGDVAVKLATNPATLSAFRAALNAKGDRLHPYETNFITHIQGEPQQWANLVWAQMKETPQADSIVYKDFFAKIQPHNKLRPLVLDGLIQSENIKILKFALNAVIAQNDKTYLSSVQNLTRHWADDIRFLARLAEKKLNGQIDTRQTGAFAKARKDIRAADRARIKACRVNGKAATDYVRQLPFFTLEEEVSQSYLKRRNIQSVYPTKPGWLVGFAPENHKGKPSGGLWYFDNKTGLGQIIDPDKFSSISAILPIHRPKPGQYTSDFWVMSADTGKTSQGRLYRVDQSGSDISSVFLQFLPSASFDATLLPDDQYLLKRADHSPLILMPNGQIKPACE